MPEAATPTRQTSCCIVGGGPAGVMLGLLLSRQNIEVTVLEKHKDFFRDFRGDTIHPSSLQLMHELGLLEDLLALPHQEYPTASLSMGGESMLVGDFTTLPTAAKFIALMPQWDFLNFLSAHAAKYPSFTLLMEHEVTGFLESPSHRVTGVRANTPAGPVDIQAKLVVGCDGRNSISRSSSHLHTHETGVPIDVLWFRLTRLDTDTSNALGNVNYGTVLVLINRGDYYQCAFIIAKDSFTNKIQPAGLPAFQAKVAHVAPFLADRVHEITDWTQVKLLTVQINRLTRWHRPGLLCIGDAAHAMSPVGGIGINLAIQDAVASARILAPALRNGLVTEFTLAHIQSRRELPTRLTQSFQVFAHRMLTRILGNPAPVTPPPILRYLTSKPWFHRLTARFIGMGIRPEHINPH